MVVVQGLRKKNSSSYFISKSRFFFFPEWHSVYIFYELLNGEKSVYCKHCYNIVAKNKCLHCQMSNCQTNVKCSNNISFDKNMSTIYYFCSQSKSYFQKKIIYSKNTVETVTFAQNIQSSSFYGFCIFNALIVESYENYCVILLIFIYLF